MKTILNAFKNILRNIKHNNSSSRSQTSNNKTKRSRIDTKHNPPNDPNFIAADQRQNSKFQPIMNEDSVSNKKANSQNNKPNAKGVTKQKTTTKLGKSSYSKPLTIKDMLILAKLMSQIGESGNRSLFVARRNKLNYKNDPKSKLNSSSLYDELHKKADKIANAILQGYIDNMESLNNENKTNVNSNHKDEKPAGTAAPNEKRVSKEEGKKTSADPSSSSENSTKTPPPNDGANGKKDDASQNGSSTDYQKYKAKQKERINEYVFLLRFYGPLLSPFIVLGIYLFGPKDMFKKSVLAYWKKDPTIYFERSELDKKLEDNKKNEQAVKEAEKIQERENRELKENNEQLILITLKHQALDIDFLRKDDELIKQRLNKLEKRNLQQDQEIVKLPQESFLQKILGQIYYPSPTIKNPTTTSRKSSLSK